MRADRLYADAQQRFIAVFGPADGSLVDVLQAWAKTKDALGKKKAGASSSLCPFLCPFGPALGPLSPGASGIARGQERQIVRPAWVYTCSCRDSAAFVAA